MQPHPHEEVESAESAHPHPLEDELLHSTPMISRVIKSTTQPTAT